ncbi:MAG: hypothetical protein ACRD1K_11815 [Acidimicrobiales bacterium]
MRTRKGVLAGFGALAAGVLIGGAAFACTPQASLRANPTSGAAGSTITASGGTFDAAGGPVKVWFDGAGRTQIGSATVNADRTFSVQVVIPATATGGTHIISATQSDAQGQPIAGSPVNTTFRVDGPIPAAGPANVQGSAPEDAQGAAALAPAPVTEATPAAAPVAAPVAARAPARTPARVATPAPAAAPAVAPAPAPVAVTPAPAVAPAPEVVPAPAVVAPAPPVQAPAPAVQPAPAAQQAQQSSDDGGTSGLVLAGLAVLALGLFAVGTGIFVTERKRSRARG